MTGGWGTKTAPYTFTATVADTIYFVCSAHVTSGMKGRIIVLPPAGVDNENTGQRDNESIYPNPCTDIITISKTPTEGSDVQIYNMLGELIMNLGSVRELYSRVNISDLPKGMYFVKIDKEFIKFVKL